ncbi:MAG: hypothetical protein LIP02_11230 [Bacteroidales bacterium]|nr:hypothetical protein [Bacteroidales bacterium]
MKFREFGVVVAMLITSAFTANAQEVEYTSPEHLTPLVGRYCLVNDLDTSLISVLNGATSVNALLDTNVDNYMSIAGLASINLAYQPIISVKDTQHIYAAGTVAGFELDASNGGTSLLSVDVLSSFAIATYLNGEKQEESMVTSDSSVANIGLIKFNQSGKSKVSFTTTLPFDEVRLVSWGVSIDVINALKIYYAFVGDNPQISWVKANFPDITVHNHLSTTTTYNNIIKSEDDGMAMSVLLGGIGNVIINPGTEEWFPANTEVGFVMEAGTVLDLSIASSMTIKTYALNGCTRDRLTTGHKCEEVESYTVDASVVGVELIGGGRYKYSFVASKPFQMIGLKWGELTVNVGAKVLYYMYTKDNTAYPYEDCDFYTDADVNLCGQSSYTFTGAAGTTYSILSQPEGASATISGSTISGMNVQGEYKVLATLGDCSHEIIVTRDPQASLINSTSRPIVGDGVSPWFTNTSWGLLKLNLADQTNLLKGTDLNLDNYYEYSDGLGLDLIGKNEIYGVTRTDGEVYYASEAQPRRVGFVVEPSNSLIGLDLLNYYCLTTYLKGVKQETSVADENSTVGLSLISEGSGKTRVSFKATMPFDAVVLSKIGTLTLDLFNDTKIYYAFEEPATDSSNAAAYANQGFELLSTDAQGATICYDHTGFPGLASAAEGIHDLCHLVDGDLDTYTEFAGLAGVASKSQVAVKANRVFSGNGRAGFLVKSNKYLGSADVISSMAVETLLDGAATGDKDSDLSVASVDLLGHSGLQMLFVETSHPFDEIHLSVTGLVNAIENLEIYTAFFQRDTDGDGTADAIDLDPCNTGDGEAIQVPVGVSPVSVYEPAQWANFYANHVNVIFNHDMDPIRASDVQVGSVFTITRYDDVETEPITLGTLTVTSIETLADGTLVYSTALKAMHRANVLSVLSDVKFQSKGGSNPIVPYAPYRYDYSTGANAILIPFIDTFSANVIDNTHPYTYTYQVTFQSDATSAANYSNIKNVDIPHATIDGTLLTHTADEVKADVNRVLGSSHSRLTITPITDENGHSYAIYKIQNEQAEQIGSAASSDEEIAISSQVGRNVPVVASIIESTTYLGEEQVNTYGTPETYIQPTPSVKLSLPELSLWFDHSTQRQAWGSDSPKVLDITHPSNLELSHFNIWRKTDAANDEVHDYDSATGFNIEGEELLSCQEGNQPVEEESEDDGIMATSLDDTDTDCEDFFDYSDVIYVQDQCTKSVSVTYVARAYFRVLSDDTVSSSSRLRDASVQIIDGEKYVVVETTATVSKTVQTGVEDVIAGADAPAIYYNLQGQRVLNPQRGQLLVKVQGNTTQKVLY